MKTLKSLIFCLIVFLGVSSVATAAPLSLDPIPTFYVKPLGTGDCLDWDAACDLQTALSTANPGDQVWVAAGTYKPTDTAERSATFQLESGVAIYGGFPALGGTWEQRDWAINLTTLSGDIGTLEDSTDNSYHVVNGNGVDGTAIMDGFTISDGNANGDYSYYFIGGGMYNTNNSSPTLTNVTFSANSAISYGGGLYNQYSSNPTLINVTFSGNESNSGGGGMYNYYSSPTLTNVTFSTNSATNSTTTAGGGMCNYYSSPTLINVIFSGNSATNGGGMVNSFSGPTLTNVTFSVNPANYGGGMYNIYSSPSLINVTFSGNPATIGGGGMYNDSSRPTLTNVTFSANSAAYGGGMYNRSSSILTLTNAIVWGNTPALDQIDNDGTGSAIINYSDIQGGGYPDSNNIDADPLLGTLADNGGFTQTHALGYGSPAIDAGDPNELNCPVIDQRGYMRPIDGDDDGTAVCDMGAYEYYHSVYLPIIIK